MSHMFISTILGTNSLNSADMPLSNKQQTNKFTLSTMASAEHNSLLGIKYITNVVRRCRLRWFGHEERILMIGFPYEVNKR